MSLIDRVSAGLDQIGKKTAAGDRREQAAHRAGRRAPSQGRRRARPRLPHVSPVEGGGRSRRRGRRDQSAGSRRRRRRWRGSRRRSPPSGARPRRAQGRRRAGRGRRPGARARAARAGADARRQGAGQERVAPVRRAAAPDTKVGSDPAAPDPSPPSSRSRACCLSGFLGAWRWAWRPPTGVAVSSKATGIPTISYFTSMYGASLATKNVIACGPPVRSTRQQAKVPAGTVTDSSPATASVRVWTRPSPLA